MSKGNWRRSSAIAPRAGSSSPASAGTNGSGGLGGRATYTPAPYNTTQENSTNFYLNQGFGCSGFTTNVVNLSTSGCVNPAINDPRKFATNTKETVSLDETFVLAAEFTYHFDNFDVKYIGGGTNYHYTLVQDNDGGPVSQYTIPVNPFNPAIPGNPAATQPCAASNLVAPGSCAPLTIFPVAVTTYQEDKRWMSHEINFSSNGDGPLQWLAGAYYYMSTTASRCRCNCPASSSSRRRSMRRASTRRPTGTSTGTTPVRNSGTSRTRLRPDRLEVRRGVQADGRPALFA